MLCIFCIELCYSNGLRKIFGKETNIIIVLLRKIIENYLLYDFLFADNLLHIKEPYHVKNRS